MWPVRFIMIPPPWCSPGLLSEGAEPCTCPGAEGGCPASLVHGWHRAWLGHTLSPISLKQHILSCLQMDVRVRWGTFVKDYSCHSQPHIQSLSLVLKRGLLQCGRLLAVCRDVALALHSGGLELSPDSCPIPPTFPGVLSLFLMTSL
jgi:hypothetical protein